MSRAPVHIAAGLLEAGWQVAGVEFDGLDGVSPRTVTIVVRTPPIDIDSDDPQLQHLIARAMGGAPKEH